MKRIAECCCGECNIGVESDPLIHVVCNCNNCKKRTGSGFGISAYFGDDQVASITGKFKEYNIGKDGYSQSRFFCENCGTTLYWKIAAFPDVVGIAVGCFTRQPLSKPSVVANKHQQHYWFCLDGDWEESFDPNILVKYKSVS